MRKFFTGIAVALVVLLGGTAANPALADPASEAPREVVSVTATFGSTLTRSFADSFPGATDFSLDTQPTLGTASFLPEVPASLRFQPPLIPPAGLTTAHVETITASATGADGVRFEFDIEYTIKHDAQLSLTISPSTPQAEDPFVITAQLSSTASDLSGSVSFFIGGGSADATVPLDENGVATFNAPARDAGFYSLWAIFHENPSVRWYWGPTQSFEVGPAKATTTTTITASPEAPTFGDATTLTATVSPSAASGTVSFISDGEVLGTSTLADGQATLTSSTLPAGTRNITAEYAGDADHKPSTSAPFTLTVSKAAPMLALTTSTPAASIYGDPSSFTATLSSPHATGTVDFVRNGSTIGTAAINNGIATIDDLVLPVGDHPVSANYSGDTNFTGASATSLPVLVSRGSTDTRVSLSRTNASPTTPIDITATVTALNTAGAPVATAGSVEFYAGTTSLGSVALVNGTATLSGQRFEAGTHPITAQYLGSDQHTSSISPEAFLYVVKTMPAVSLTVSTATPSYGDPVELRAEVTPAGATGTVSFALDGDPIGTVPLIDGAAELSTSEFPVGDATITATYSGDSNLTPTTSPGVSVSTAQAVTATTLTLSDTEVVPGDPVDISATVSSTNSVGDPVPTIGTVEFFSGGDSLGTAPLLQGVATLPGLKFETGGYVITAIYNGSATHLDSTSNAVDLKVAKLSTTTSLTASQAKITVGETVKLTATVAPGTSAGQVKFFADGAALGEAPVTGGIAELEVGDLSVGTSNITAEYVGDAQHEASTSAAIPVEVTRILPKFSITTTPLAPRDGEAFTISATAMGSAPTGTITFVVTADASASKAAAPQHVTQGQASGDPAAAPADTFTLTSTQTLAKGTASFVVPALPAGSYSISARYGGDAQHAPITLNTTRLSVAEAAVPSTAPTKPGTAAKQPALAETGADSLMPGAWAALTLITAGLILFTRRRKATRS